MPATPFDSATFRDLFLDVEVGALFTDSAEIRAMLLVEGALAKAQGSLGVIPDLSAAAIHRATMEVLIDPRALSAETGQSAVVIPALVKALRAEMKAPEHSQYVHWGATSQDILETAQILRLRRVLDIYEGRLTDLLKAIGRLAGEHATLPMAARTYGQTATVTSFGTIVAGWGRPLLRRLDAMDQVRMDLLTISLSGAAGTLSAMGARGPQVRAEMARALDLSDPESSWHSERDRLSGLSAWITQTATALGKIGEDLILLTQTDTGEVRLAQGGGSSTMPQKSNPVLPSLLVALARHLVALNATMQGADLHRQQRDGAAWFTEWLSLPQMCLGLARGLSAATDLIGGITPDPTRMRAAIDDGTDLVHAEALSFALSAILPRPEAQSSVKALCERVRQGDGSLGDLARKTWPEQDFADLFTPERQLGTAPDEARRFERMTGEL